MSHDLINLSPNTKQAEQINQKITLLIP